MLVVDFKSDATVPEVGNGVPASYLTQLGLYALVAGQLFPGREVSAGHSLDDLGIIDEFCPTKSSARGARGLHHAVSFA